MFLQCHRTQDRYRFEICRAWPERGERKIRFPVKSEELKMEQLHRNLLPAKEGPSSRTTYNTSNIAPVVGLLFAPLTVSN